jgi:ATP-dependent Clp protease adaptor protein ClpS
MAEQDQDKANEGGAATLKPKQQEKTAPVKKPPQPLPPWKVLLHNDNKNTFEFVIVTILELTPLDEHQAIQRTKQAHEDGVALLLTTHKERAELYADQFQSKGLKVTIEAAE